MAAIELARLHRVTARQPSLSPASRAKAGGRERTCTSKAHRFSVCGVCCSRLTTRPKLEPPYKMQNAEFGMQNGKRPAIQPHSAFCILHFAFGTGVPDRLRSGDLLHERQACWLDYTTGTGKKTPSTKLQIPKKHQNPSSKLWQGDFKAVDQCNWCVVNGRLEFEVWSLFGTWSLGFGAFILVSPAGLSPAT